MKNLNILIGAGFSAPANYPTGENLNTIFSEGVENRIARESSGEWFWIEKDSDLSDDGTQKIEFSYLLSEYIYEYINETKIKFNYEEFYDWYLKKKMDFNFLSPIIDRVNKRIKNETIPINGKYQIIENKNIDYAYKLDKIFNYLIGDILSGTYSRIQKGYYYKPFIDYILKYENVNLFTLNHDLLLEYLLGIFGIKYSDGFTSENSSLFGEKDDQLKIFNEKAFNEKIKLYKLHGSIDLSRFEGIFKKNAFSYRTNKFIYFKPETYRNNQLVYRKNLKTGEIIQNFNWETVPKFLTGMNKINIIKNDYYYNFLYDTFNKSFENCNELIIIGYSFSDSHINKVLQYAVQKFNFEILNINPNVKFPFSTKCNVKNIEDINKI